MLHIGPQPRQLRQTKVAGQVGLAVGVGVGEGEGEGGQWGVLGMG